MTTAIETNLNGVDRATMFGTLYAIKETPELGRFQFRVDNEWVNGAHNRSTIKSFYGAGGEDSTRTTSFTLDAGEPQILLGSDTGPNPGESLLHALAACLTTSLVYVAAARGVKLTEVRSHIEGNMDVRGALGLDDDYRNGFEDIKVTFTVEGDADAEQLQMLVDRASLRSAVFDMVRNGVPIEIELAS